MDIELTYLPDTDEWKIEVTVDSVPLRPSDRATLQDLVRHGRGFVEHDADRRWIGGFIARFTGTLKPRMING